jgi:transcriptional regulator with XRE-family HTH domain
MSGNAAAFTAARQAIGWSRAALGAAFGVDEKQIRRWEAGADIPEPALEWALALAGWLARHPPPRRPWDGTTAP